MPREFSDLEVETPQDIITISRLLHSLKLVMIMSFGNDILDGPIRPYYEAAIAHLELSVAELKKGLQHNG